MKEHEELCAQLSVDLHLQRGENDNIRVYYRPAGLDTLGYFLGCVRPLDGSYCTAAGDSPADACLDAYNSASEAYGALLLSCLEAGVRHVSDERVRIPTRPSAERSS